MDLACQLGLWLPAWTAESYVSIPPQFQCESATRLLNTFRGVKPLDCLYKQRACSPKAGSEERGGQLSGVVLRAELGAREAEQLLSYYWKLVSHPCDAEQPQFY
jgi:hypothetical protein